MNRRQFIKTTVGCTSAVLGAFQYEAEAEMQNKLKLPWEIGCFNRPWGAWSYDDALTGIKAAGFHLTGMLGENKGEMLLKTESTPEYLDKLSSRIEMHGLKPIMARLVLIHDIPVKEGISQISRQIDSAHRMKLKTVMTLGTAIPSEYEQFYRVMSHGAAYAANSNIQLVFKPHGGCSAAADEILHCIERVNHPNFTLWFDAGNIIYYTDKDPVTELARVAKYVTGFCAKDCAVKGGDVMLQFGTGKVDFVGVFQKLKEAHFKGPVMVECCAGKTIQEVTDNARANRLFLEKIFEEL